MAMYLMNKRLDSGNYLLAQHRVYKFDEDHILITTDTGAWVVLNKEEHKLFRSARIEEDFKLFSLLKESGIIITEDNINEVVDDLRNRYLHLFKGPDLHIVVPTFRCNMKCIYCHSFSKPLDAKGFDMDQDTAKSIIDFIFATPADSFTIEFQGGDCLYNFEVVEFILDYAKKLANEQKKKVTFSLVTNLTHMSEDVIKTIKKNIPIGLCTSLDGPKEVHDKNRKYLGGGGSYDDVVYWIKRLKEEMKGYDFKFHALTTVTRFSLDYPKEIVDEFVNLGFFGVWLRFMNNLGFAQQVWDKIGYTAEEYVKFWKEAVDYAMVINREGIEFREVWANLVAWVILGRKSTTMVDFRSPCGAGIGQLLYDHKGDVYTCDEAKVLDIFKLGNVKENKYEDIIRNPTTTTMVDISSKFCSLCDACPWFAYCALCPVNIYTSQGSVVPKLPEDMRCKIFREMIRTVFEKLVFSEPDRKILKYWARGNV